MDETMHGLQPTSPGEAAGIEALYRLLIDSWNKRDAAGFAALFASNGNVVGFDGSPVDGSTAIATHLRQIFTDHQTATYVAKIREIRFNATTQYTPYSQTVSKRAMTFSGGTPV